MIYLDRFSSFFFTDSVIKEVIRVTSGVFMVRAITKDTEFQVEDGRTYNLRKGDRIAMYPPAIHKDPEIFEDPMVSRAISNKRELVYFQVRQLCQKLYLFPSEKDIRKEFASRGSKLFPRPIRKNSRSKMFPYGGEPFSKGNWHTIKQSECHKQCLPWRKWQKHIPSVSP